MSLIINYELPEYKKSFDRFVSETFSENNFTQQQLIKLIQALRLYGIKVTCIIVEKLYSDKYRLMVYYTAIYGLVGMSHKETLLTFHPNILNSLKNKKYIPIKLYDFNRKTHINGSIKTLNEYVLEYFNTDLTEFILVDTYANMYEHNFNIIKEQEKEYNETNRKKNVDLKKSPEYIELKKQEFEARKRARLLKFIEGHINRVMIIAPFVVQR